jgi:hypothetical protein
MSYGARRERPRRKSTAQPHDIGPDPTILPQSSYFGFLDRFPFKMSKGVKYRPSAADLREHPGALKDAPEEEALMEDSDEEATHANRGKHKRNRSGTSTSGHTTDSLSSRGDIFPSEDELDDAVPLDDEFAMALERRTTSHVDESSSGRTRSHKGSRVSLRTASSKSIRRPSSHEYHESSNGKEPPTLTELKAEEEALQKEEEESIEQKRRAAKRLAMRRGLSSPGPESKPDSPGASSPPPVTELSSKSPSITGVVPFPSFDPSRTPGTVTPAEEAADEERATGSDAELEPHTESHTESHGVAVSSATQSSPPEESHFVPAALPRFSSEPD